MNFDIPIEFGAIKLIAVMCRVGAFFFAMPFFMVDQVPMQYKVLATTAISIMMYPLLAPAWNAEMMMQNMTLLKLVSIVSSEIMLGLAINLFVLAAIDIFTYAGAVIDIDIGFNVATEFDPMGEQRSLVSGFLVRIFILMFVVTDGHLEAIKIAASSFEILPPGTFLFTEDLLEGILRAVNAIFTVGTQLALPMIVTMFMINIGLGILARIGQDFPVMMLSFGIHLGVGLIILLVMLPSILEFCRDAGKLINENIVFILGTV